MTALKSVALLAAGAGLALAGSWAWQARQTPAGDKPPVAAETAEPDPLALDAGQRARLGITTGVLVAAQDQAGTTGFARVLDAGPLAAIDSEIMTAAAAASASAAEAARLQELARQDQSASARSVQAAMALATADRQRTALAQRRIALEFGPGLARLGAKARAALIADVTTGRAALLRIDVPGINVAVSQISVGEPSVRVEILGAAAAADARVQGAALLAVLHGPAARTAAAGRLFPAQLADGRRQSGAIIPNAAVVRADGQLWLFVPKGNGFERVAIDGARPVADGWFTTTGVRPGDHVVTSGAGALLGIEHGPAPEGE